MLVEAARSAQGSSAVGDRLDRRRSRASASSRSKRRSAAAPHATCWQAWRRAALDFGALIAPARPQVPTSSSAARCSSRRAPNRPRASSASRRRDATRVSMRSLVNARSVASEAGGRRRRGAPQPRRRDARSVSRDARLARAAAESRGAQIFERFAGEEGHVQPQRRGGDDRRRHASAPDRVVVATGRPTPLFRALIRHFWFKSTLSRADRAGPARRSASSSAAARSVIRDSGEPPHVDPLGRRRSPARERRGRRGAAGSRCARRRSCSGPVS